MRLSKTSGASRRCSQPFRARGAACGGGLQRLVWRSVKTEDWGVISWRNDDWESSERDAQAGGGACGSMYPWVTDGVGA